MESLCCFLPAKRFLSSTEQPATLCHTAWTEAKCCLRSLRIPQGSWHFQVFEKMRSWNIEFPKSQKHEEKLANQSFKSSSSVLTSKSLEPLEFWTLKSFHHPSQLLTSWDTRRPAISLSKWMPTCANTKTNDLCSALQCFAIFWLDRFPRVFQPVGFLWTMEVQFVLDSLEYVFKGDLEQSLRFHKCHGLLAIIFLDSDPLLINWQDWSKFWSILPRGVQSTSFLIAQETF